MKAFVLSSWILVSFYSSSSLAQDCFHDKGSLRCVEYSRNYDGDTITVDIPEVHALIGRQITVRVRGIDAPERHSADPCEREMAEEARLYVEGVMLEAQTIELRKVARGKYFRILAEVIADGKSLAKGLLKRGLAVPYHGKARPHPDWCQKRP